MWVWNTVVMRSRTGARAWLARDLTVESGQERGDFGFDGERRRGAGFKTGAERVGIHFQWDGVIAAAGEESLNVKIGEAADGSKLAVLFDVDKFVEEQGGSEWLVGNDDLIETDSGHLCEVWEILEAEHFEHGVEARIFDAFVTQGEDADGFKEIFAEKPFHGGFLGPSEIAGSGEEVGLLFGDVFGDEGGSHFDLLGGELERHGLVA